MLLKICRPRQRRVGRRKRFCGTRPVILSGVIASLREAITKSKDPYSSNGVARICKDLVDGVPKSVISDQLIGVLRLPSGSQDEAEAALRMTGSNPNLCVNGLRLGWTARAASH